MLAVAEQHHLPRRVYIANCSEANNDRIDVDHAAAFEEKARTSFSLAGETVPTLEDEYDCNTDDNQRCCNLEIKVRCLDIPSIEGQPEYIEDEATSAITDWESLRRESEKWRRESEGNSTLSSFCTRECETADDEIDSPSPKASPVMKPSVYFEDDNGTHFDSCSVCTELTRKSGTKGLKRASIESPIANVSVPGYDNFVKPRKVGLPPRNENYNPAAHHEDQLMKTVSKEDYLSKTKNGSCMPKKNLSVRFSTVEIRQYERVLGDNPACSDGPPLSLGWNFYPDRTVLLPMVRYEQFRLPHRVKHYQMQLSRSTREYILLNDLGYSKHDLANALRSVYRTKHQRTTTCNNLPVTKMEETFEKARSRVKNYKLFNIKKKKTEKRRSV